MNTPSYPSIYALGHRAIRDMLQTDVIVEEKVDGSQFTFGRLLDGTFVCRSKGKDIVTDAPEKMFIPGVCSTRNLDLQPGWLYRGEYLSKPQHNTLAYNRHPEGYVILFDVETGVETYLNPQDKADEAKRLGLECVPLIYSGRVTSLEMLTAFMDRESILGGCKIEGIVIKNYLSFTPDKKISIAKIVSAEFKEQHQGEWKKSNPTSADVVQALSAEFRAEARWNKAIQHKREDGLLKGEPSDIGLLIREIPDDILKEHGDEIKERLFAHFWPQIRRGVTAGFPEFYKQQLAQAALN